MPRVTVLMPVYNAERFVGDAVASVLAQAYTDFELLVIDDGSTDRSAEILASIDDPRLRVVPNGRNLGLVRTLNRGLALAHGALIARQDADDLSEPNRLARQVEFLDANPGVALVGSWYRKIDERGTVLGDRELPLDSTALAWAMLFYCPIVHSAVMFRREAVVEAGGYDERFGYGEDYDLWSRLIRRHRIATLPEFLVRYRVASTTMTATIGEGSGETARIAIANIASLVDARGGGAVPTSDEHRAMYDTLYDAGSTTGSAAIVVAFAQILALLDAFCRQPSVKPPAADDLRARVHTTLRRRLVEWIDRFADDDFSRARALVAADARWLGLLATRPARSAFHALHCSPVGRTLGRWAGL